MKALRIIVFNMDESYGPTLRSTLTACSSVRIVAEVDDAALLPHVATQFKAEVLLLHLDPTPECVLPLVSQVTAEHPDLAVFALSESTDGQLILSTMRQGCREFLTRPIDESLLADALQKVADRHRGEDRSGKLISFLSTSGGAGATVLATNLAVELAELESQRVTLVDLDYRFGQVATLLDVSPSYTIADLAATPEQLEPDLIEKALVKHSSGVYVLSRPQHFVQCENITAANCAGVLTGLLAMSEYVVVDGPNRYDVGASAVLDLADITFLVVQSLVPSVRNAQRILEGMREAGFNLDRTHLLCNREGVGSKQLQIADIEATLGKKVFATIPDDWPTVSAAVNLGETLAARGPKTRVRLALRELAERIHTADQPDGVKPDETKKGTGLLSKMF